MGADYFDMGLTGKLVTGEDPPQCYRSSSRAKRARTDAMKERGLRSP